VNSAWDTQESDWFSDEAVVFEIAGRTMGINCRGLDEIAVRWDGIDFGSPPCWVGDWGAELSLEWRRNGHPQLALGVGQKVRGINHAL